MFRTYQSIRDLIKETLLLPKWVEAVVRRSLIRPGGGVADLFFEYFYRLPPGGRPGDALTKLQEPPSTNQNDFLARHAVGWRGPGTPRHLGTDSSWSYKGQGPPCSTRVYSAQHLRDNALLSGVDNQNKFGYSYDLWADDATGSGDGTINSWWYRRAINLPNAPVGSGDGGYWGNPNQPLDADGQFPLQTWGSNKAGRLLRARTSQGQAGAIGEVSPVGGSRERMAYSGWARIIAYITRAEHNYRLVLTYSEEGTEPPEETPKFARHFIPMGQFTGRFVSDWLPATYWLRSGTTGNFTYTRYTLERPAWGPDLSNIFQTTGYIQNVPDQETLVNVEHSATTGRPVGTPDQLASGSGPLCIPFIEVEVKTLYNPQGVWEVQNANTPEEWRKTEMQRRIEAGEWPYPTSWPY